MADEVRVQSQCLSHQCPINRIAVRRRQVIQPENMVQLKRHNDELVSRLLTGDNFYHRESQRQLA